MTRTIPNMSRLILDFFGKKTQQLSQVSGFCQRRSKLSGEKFVSSVVLSFINNPSSSLEDICQLLKQGKCCITKQGLHERFNAQSVELMKRLFEESVTRFKTQSPMLLTLLQSFSSVYLLDSSGFKLPKTLSEEFKGNGGTASPAGLKLQVMLDYLNGLDNVWVTGATTNDQGFKAHLSSIKKDGLYLQDLGYFVLDNFEAIQAQGGYFISRFLKKTHVFTLHEELDLLETLKNAGPYFEQELYIGKKKRFFVRLLAERVPDAVAQKRIREEKAYAKRKGYTPSARSLALMHWSIYITNISASLLSLEQVLLVYKLRWQVELFFKLGKSEFALHKIVSKNRNRILCELYAKLIGVVLLLFLTMPVRFDTYSELSYRKAFKKLSLMVLDWYRALKSPYRLTQFLKKLLDDFKDFAFKDRRLHKKKTTLQQLMDSVGQKTLPVKHDNVFCLA